MKNSTPDFSLEILMPYIRLTNSGKKYTLCVMVPLPVNYHVQLKNNPTIKIDEDKNQVNVIIKVAGPVKNPANEWVGIPLKIGLPSLNSGDSKIDLTTSIITTIKIKDTDDLEDGEGGSTESKYEDSMEE